MEEFQEAGLSEEDMYLIQFMADQEVGHATIFENFLYRRFFLFFQSLCDTDVAHSQRYGAMRVHLSQLHRRHGLG